MLLTLERITSADFLSKKVCNKQRKTETRLRTIPHLAFAILSVVTHFWNIHEFDFVARQRWTHVTLNGQKQFDGGGGLRLIENILEYVLPF